MTCNNCGESYLVHCGIIDFLQVPTAAVAQELSGLALENNITLHGDFGNVKFLRTDHIETISELMEGTRQERTQYYQQTTAAFYEGLARARPDAGLRALEIGSERTYFKLRTIEGLCSEAYALNIFFNMTTEADHVDWPTRVLGDMNDLPFADNYLDLIICSATLHHTGSLEQALVEIARVLRIGGRAIVINEPIEGWVKAGGLKQGLPRHSRHENIHEDPVTWRRWYQAIRHSGLTADYFVPAWFLQQVANAQALPDNVRFAGLARKVGPLLNRSALQDLTRTIGRLPGQVVLGLPLNVVLWKPPAQGAP